MADLVIRINGDVKSFEDALKKAQEKSEALEGQLKKVATISGVAFAALTAEIGVSVAAFAESEKAANQLTTALQNQGIYSKELKDEYDRQASALQNLSGVSDEAVTRAQALLQAQIGSTKITQELTLAMGDLSAAKNLDLETTAELIGKGINGNVAALKKLGIEVTDLGDRQANMAQIVQKVTEKFGGQAEVAGKGLGVYTKLKETIGNLQEEIGSRFAPAVERVGIFLNSMFKTISQNKILVDLTVSVIAAGAAVAGIVTVVGLAGIGFLKLKAALEAAHVATSAMTIATRGLAAATGLGLILVLVSTIALNWSEVWPRMQGIFQAFVNNVGSLATGLGNILKGVFTLDRSLISQGMEEAKNAFTEGFADYTAHVDAAKAERGAVEAEQEQLKRDRNRQVLTEEQEEQKRILAGYHAQRAEEQKKANERFIIEQHKFGTAYAMISKIMHSEVLQGTKSATGELAALQQSSNSTLKGIGKAAAVAQIVIKTAESAMNIYAGFSTIPIIGPALGVAGAAAAIAFGGEQIGKVQGAAEGGLITGGIPGVDSVPVLAQSGELVSPASNFNEVIGSVRAMREAENLMGDGGFGGNARVTVEFIGDLASVVEAKIVERQKLGLSILRTV